MRSIDPAARLCVAASGETFADLVAATLPHGLIPMIVPALRATTIAEAVEACTPASRSFEHGGFQDTCRACGPSNVTVRLTPARPFVEVTEETYGEVEAYLAAIRRHADRHDVDFMDGVINSCHDLALSVGRFVDDDAGRQPTEQYLFRHDPGGAKPARHLPGWVRALVSSTRPRGTLDVFVPISRVPAFLEWYERGLGSFPLRCVPYRSPGDDELFLDLGIDCGEASSGHPAYSELEFWSLWNRASFDEVKRRFHPRDLVRAVRDRTRRLARVRP